MKKIYLPTSLAVENSKAFILQALLFSKKIALLSIFSLFIVCMGVTTYAQSVGQPTVTGTPVCAGSDVTVVFDVTNGATAYYNSATTYQAYISDGSGNFPATPVTLGPAFTLTALYNTNPGSTISGLSRTFTIPVGFGTGNYKIAIGSSGPDFDGSTGANGSSGFTINGQIIPGVTIASNAGTTICAGTSVTFTATPANGGTTPTYQWYLNNVAVSGQTNATFITNTLANGNQVKVEMTSNGVCPVPAVVTSNTITMTVNPVLTPTISIISTQTIFCSGTSVTFSEDVLTNGGLTPTYQWRLNGATVGTNSNSFTSTTLSNNDIVTLNVTSSATCATPTMVTSNAIQVTVNPNLPVSVSVGASATTICAGTSVTFTATPTNGGSSPSYQWKVNGVNAGSNSNTFTTTSLTNGQVVTVVLTSNATPCATSNPATSAGITMTVNPNLPVSVSVGASATTICAGTSVTFTATPTNGGASPSYQWQVNGVNAGTNSNTFTTSALTNGQVVSVVLTSNATPCATGNPATSTGITMTVNPNLPVSVSVSGSATTICPGTSVTFTATPTNGGASPSYQWKVDGVNTGTNSNTFTTTSLTNGQVVTVVLTSNATPCATSNPATSAGITMTVNPNLPVSVSVGASATTICAGTSVTFTATPTNGGASPSYQWQVNGVNAGTNSNTFTTSALTNGQVVSVVLTSNATPCATGNPATSTGITMTVNPNLPVSVSVSASATTICPGTSVTFTATPTNGGASPSYQWKVEGVNTGTNSNTFTTSALTNGQVVSVVLTSNATPCATGNPATSTGIAITVNPNSPVSVSVSASATTICTGTSVTFTATPTNGGASPSYQWKVDGVNTGTNSNIFTTSALTNGQIVTVVLTSNVTCATGNPATSTGITMTVNPNLPVSVSVGASATTICAGTSVTFTATPTNGGTSPSYQWKVNGVNAGINSNTFTTTTLTNGQVVTVVLTSNATPCATGNPATSAGITMTVNPLTTPAVSIAANAISICNGTAVTFTATPTNGGAIPSYQWRIGAANVGTNSPTFSTSALTNGQVVSVIMTSNAACSSPATATSNLITMTVYTGTPSLPANSISGPNAVCPVVSATYSVTPLTGATGATVYTWTLPTGWVVNSGQGTSSVNVTATGSAVIGKNQDITVEVSNPCGTGNSRTFKVDVNTFAAVNLGADFSMCSGTSTTITPVLTGNANALPTFTASSGTLTGSLPTYTFTPSITSGTVTFNAITNDPAGSCVSGSDALIITVNQAVVITAQPAPTQTVCSGSNVSFSVAAMGTGITYQWRKGTINLTNTGNISGATTQTLTLTGALTTDASNYNVIVSGASPCASVTSSNAALVVNQVVAISAQPAITQTVCTGNSISFSVTASGTGLSYQWRKGTTNLVNGGSVSGATTNILTINPVVSGDAATNYNVVITGTAPCVSLTSNNAALVVNDAVVITTQPSTTQTVCSGSNVSFSVAATGTGITYQWRKGTTNLTNTGNISGATTQTLTLTGALTTDAGNYNVIVSGASPCASVTSSDAALVVNQVVAISAQPAITQTVCTGNSVSFSITASGTGLSYQWRKGTTNLVNGGSVSGATTNILTINPVVSGDAAANYNVVITGTTPCVSLTSNNAALVVNDAVLITAQPAPTQTVCSGSNVSFSVAATGTGITYQWRKGTTNLTNTGNISGATTQTLTLTSALTTDAGNYNVIVSGASPCASVTSSDAALVVNQVVAISAQPAITQTVCTGNSISFSVTASGTGLSYQWRKGTTNLVNGGSVSGATTNILTINPVVSGDAAANYNVVITGTAPCVSLTSNNAALVVNDAVLITAQPAPTQTVCSGSNVSFSVAATGTGITYQWRKGTTNLTNTGNISGATTQTLTLTGALTTDAGNYNVIVSGASPCASVTSSDAALVVNQVVAISAQPAITQTVCTGNSASFSITASGTGLSYQWRKGTTNLVNGGSVSGATTNILTINPVVSGDAAANYNVVITGTAPCTAVTSNNSALVVNDAVVITTQPSTTQTVCSGSNVSFSVTATGTGITYQWRKGTTNLTNTGNISGATTQTLTLTGAMTTDAGNYNVVITGVGPCVPVTSNNAALLVNRAVSINTQPSNVGICASNPASLSVVASGGAASYQWYKGTFPGTALSNSTFITGAQTNILNFSQAFVADDGIYYVEVSGASPCAFVRSNEVTLNVDQSIIITNQPTTQTVCNGATNVNFTVVANAGGDPLTYQWRKGGVNIAGATAATYTIATVASTDAGNYDVVISGPSGYTCSTVTSVSVALIVTPTVTINVFSSATSTRCQGAATVITTTTANNSTGITYSLDATTAAFAGNSINSATGAVTYAAGWSGTTTITASAAGCNGPATTTHVVTITPTVTINAFTLATSIRCQGAGTVITTTTANNSTGITYSLDATTAAFVGNSINTATGAVTYAAGWSGTTTITASAAGCNGPATTTHVVTITPTVTINAFAPAISIRCQGAGTVITTTTANNSTGITYSLDATTAAFVGNSINTATGAVTYAAGWSGTTTITASAAGCNGPATTTHVVTITPTVTINAFTPATSIRCQGAGTVITTTTANNSTGITYSLDATTAAFVGNSINTATGAVTYAAGWSGTTTITASAAGCNGPATTTHVVTITPTVTINAFTLATSIRCQGAGTVITTTTANNSTGITYSLDATTAAFVGNSINTATGAVTYAAGWSGTTTITASAAGCNGPATTTHVVTITPTVTISAFAPATSIRCQGAGTVTTTTTANNSTGITYSLDATTAAFAGNSINSGTGAVTYAAGWNGTTTITASAAGCNGPVTRAHVVTITPTVTINAFSPATSTRCQGAGSVTYTTTANNSTGITYSLDGPSIMGGNTIVATTGQVNYAAAWSGTTTITASAAGCNGPSTTTHVVTVNATTIGGTLSPSISTPLTVCSGVSGPGSILTLSGNNGTVTRWETSTNGGVSWTDNGNANNNTLDYSGITATTLYRVLVTNGTCTGAYSAIGQIVILQPFTAVITPSATATCIGVPITLTASGYSSTGKVIDEGDFTNKNPLGWSGMSGNASNNGPSDIWGWAKNDVYNGVNYSAPTPRFMMVFGAVSSSLVTPVFSTVGMSSAVLAFKEGYNLSAGTIARIEISTTGTGGPWITLKNYTSPAAATTTNPIALAAGVDLNAYLGLSNLAIRFYYQGTALSNWALDDVYVTNSISNPTASTSVYTPLSYTWSPATYLSSSSTNPTTLTPTAAGSFSYTVSTSAGGCPASTTSLAVPITVNPNPVISAMTANACSGSGFTATPVNGTNGVVPAGTTYTWSTPVISPALSTSGGSAQGTGQGIISQTLTNVTSSAATATYTVTPLSGTCTGATFTVTVTVNPRPVVPSQTITICSGASPNFVPSNNPPTTIIPTGTTYTWTNPLVTGGITGGSAQPTAQTSVNQTLTNPSNTVQTATYTVTPIGPNCTGATYQLVVTVNPTPVVPSQTITICSGSSPNFVPSNNPSTTIIPTGTTYTWTNPVVTGGIIGGSAQPTAQTSVNQTLTNPTNTVQTATYTVTPIGPNCTGATYQLVVTVNPTPVVPSQTITICSGASPNFVPSNNPPTTIIPTGTTYTWSNPVVTGGIIGGSAQPTAQTSVNQTLTNPTNTVQTATYTVTPIGPNCTGATYQLVVTVNPTPVVPSQTITICSGSSPNFIPSNNPPTTIIPTGTTYTWTNPVVTGGIIGASAQLTAQTSVNQTLTNPTNTVQTATYTVTPLVGTCTGNAFTMTVTVNPTTVAGTLPSVSVCTTGTGTLNLTGNVGNVIQWESSPNGVSSWSVISNTTTSQPYTVSATTIYYRALVQSGTCSAKYSTIATVGLHNVWTGVTSTDWNTGSNWSDGLVASNTCPIVTIPASTPNAAILSSGSPAVIISLVVDAGASLTIHGNSISIAGSITNNGIFNVKKGSLEFNGTSTQNISGNLFLGDTLRNLKVSNPNGLNIIGTNVPLYLTGEVGFGNVNNTTISTGDNLVLVSDANGTARVADLTNNNANNGDTIVGKVTVERYYPMSRSWRLVTTPLSNTGSIFDSWQAGAPTNYVPGKGMFVTGPNPTGSGGNGLDYSYYNNNSMKSWNYITGAYLNVGDTKSQLLSNASGGAGMASNIGYYAFVRGDRRRVPLDNTIFGNMNNTTLSSKGNLQTGSQTFNFPGATTSMYPLVGNPYASSVDFNLISKTNVFPYRFYVYDPSLGTVGLFVTMEDLDTTGTFQSFDRPTTKQGNHIQASQAFFVQVENNGTGSLTFNENDKSTDYTPGLFRPTKPASACQSLRVTLLQTNSDQSTLMVDATLAQFDERYNEKVDMQDALKFTNITENLSLLRYKQYLAVERRPLIKDNDTLFLQLSRTIRRNYRFAIEPANLDPTLTAFLEDSYTGKSTPINLSGSSNIDFTINADAKSSVTNRFRIVFKQAALGPLPVTFKTINANEQSGKIAVKWTVENELKIKHYEVEKSADGVSFSKVNATVATGANRITTNYNWLDVNPLTGNNFYRVRSIGLDGTFDYSNTVLVKMGKVASGIRIYPNPVTDVIGAEFKNMPDGMYNARLLNALGQTVLQKTINHAISTSMENITPDYKLLSGIYQLEITAPDKTITTVKVIVQ